MPCTHSILLFTIANKPDDIVISQSLASDLYISLYSPSNHSSASRDLSILKPLGSFSPILAQCMFACVCRAMRGGGGRINK